MVDFQVGSRVAELDVRLDRLVRRSGRRSRPASTTGRRADRARRRPTAAPARHRHRCPSRSGRSARTGANASSASSGAPAQHQTTPQTFCIAAPPGTAAPAAPSGTRTTRSAPPAPREEVAVPAEDLGRALERPQTSAPPTTVRTGLQAERERGDDAEVAASAPERPEQVLVLVLARTSRTSRRRARRRPRAGCRSTGRASRVRLPMPPPSVRPPTPVVEMIPNGPRARSPGRVVDVAERERRRERSPSGVSGSTITPRIADRSITRPSSTLPRPAAVVPPAPDREVEAGLAREAHRGDHVAGVEHRAISRGPLVDHRVVELPRLLVPGWSESSTSPRKRLWSSAVNSSVEVIVAI